MNYRRRQRDLIRALESKGIDGILVRKKVNISYLVGGRGEDAVLFVVCGRNFLITNAMYEEEYLKSTENCHVKIIKDKQDERMLIRELVDKHHCKRVGFESDNFSYSEYMGLKKKLGSIILKPLQGIVESFRMLKDDDEITSIRRACKYAVSIMNYALNILRPSLREIDVKNRIEGYRIKNGIKNADFEPIIASGKNASMPHTFASRKNIRNREMVVIDLGAMNYGYNSDLTRTVFLGKINKTYLRIYNIVLDAQKRAIENIRPGVHAKAIDSISRQYISDNGLGRYFIHNLGHGIGLETHEKPHLSGNNDTILEKDMTVTVEPGIYIAKWGGVRVEDVVLINEDGCEVLTKD